jgi:hypothetical protein
VSCLGEDLDFGHVIKWFAELLTVKTLLELIKPPPQVNHPSVRIPTMYGNSSIVAFLPPRMKPEDSSAINAEENTVKTARNKTNFMIQRFAREL